MRLDWLLSALHFVLVFSLVAILAEQWALLTPEMTPSRLRLAGTLDRGYGMSAALLLGIGFARVFFGAKGSAFYLSNPVFWAKIDLFATAGLFSIPPTTQLIRWTRQVRQQTDYLPPRDEVRGIRWWLLAQSLLLVLIPFVAVAMARGYGL